MVFPGITSWGLWVSRRTRWLELHQHRCYRRAEYLWLDIVPWQCPLNLTCLLQQEIAELCRPSLLSFFLLQLALKSPWNPNLAKGLDALHCTLQYGTRFSVATPLLDVIRTTRVNLQMLNECCIPDVVFWHLWAKTFPELFTPMSQTLDKNFLLLPLAGPDGQTIVNGQRVCNCRFRRLLTRASGPRETIWNAITCVDPWVPSFLEASWSSSIA